MTEPRAENPTKADIKQYVNNKGNLTSYALQRWKEFGNKRKLNTCGPSRKPPFRPKC